MKYFHKFIHSVAYKISNPEIIAKLNNYNKEKVDEIKLHTYISFCAKCKIIKATRVSSIVMHKKVVGNYRECDIGSYEDKLMDLLT